ncbi:MAG: ATP-binding protein [Desulfobacterales bacterium]
MRILPIKKMYLPALSLVAVVFLLLVLISVSTYRNLNREKVRALHSLHRQGVALLRSVEASVRTGMKMLMWQEVSLGNLLQETAKDQDIAYFALIDEHGTIVHHSDPKKKGIRANWKPIISGEDQVVSRIYALPDNKKIFELAKIFAPMYEPAVTHSRSDMIGSRQIQPPHSHRGDIIIMGIRMTAYEEARSADVQHAFIMAAIILVLGSGALFFIFVIQNYYLVDKALRQTKDYTREVVANMANGLISLDPKGKIVSFNLLALELLDLEESEAQGMDLRKSIDFESTGIQSTLTDCIPVLEYEILHQKKFGKMVPLALSATPIKDEQGGCEGSVLVLRDLTEIKLLQQKVKRSEKLAAIGELAASVAHEIRNPLSSIRGFAQFLCHALKDRAKEKEYAEIMVIEVDRINRVVTDLLTFARPMKAELSPTDVTDLIEHSVRLVQAEALSRSVKIQMNVSNLTKLPLDQSQLSQALLNLLLNAMQAVDSEGHVEIGAVLNASESRLHLWVEDDGPGIARDKSERIFEPFFTTKEKGTGLGLAIVYKIVENHNGEIKVISPPAGTAQGCRFSIFIPITLT